MIPVDIRFQYLSRTGITYVWTISIWNWGCQVSYYRIATVFRTPIGIFGHSRRILGNNCIFESGGFKGYLPVFNSLFNKWYPFFWSCPVNIVYDLFLRLNKFSPFKFLKIFFFDL